jgi:protein TonB
MSTQLERRDLLLAAASVGAVALMAGCTSPPVPPAVTPPIAVIPAAPPVAAASAPPPNAKISNAATPRDYRRDAATHLYGQNRQRIYKGKMPPLLYAVGVLQVDVDSRGNVMGTSWMRAPSHAPEVVAEIERTVRQAAPFPAPARMGRVTYTDTWLWHKSGLFQLDTLTEGQL